MNNKLKSVELFLALGLATTVNVPATTAIEVLEETNLTNSEQLAEDTSYLLAQGGEGGEGGEGGAAEMTPGEQANAEFEDKLGSTELLNALQQGGYVIYFRHAQTEKDYADQVSADVDNCSTQRTLSEYGWRQAEVIGEAFAENSIPVGEVISSEYCRAWQTASIAFGEYEKNPALNFLPYEEYTDVQVEEMKNNVMPLLTAVPESGINTVIVGHDDIFESATGIYPAPQGMSYVLKPDGNGSFEIIANMSPEDWALMGN